MGEPLIVVVVSRMPPLLHVVEQPQAVNQGIILRRHVEQRAKPLELPRQRSIRRVFQDFGPIDDVLSKLRGNCSGVG